MLKWETDFFFDSTNKSRDIKTRLIYENFEKWFVSLVPFLLLHSFLSLKFFRKKCPEKVWGEPLTKSISLTLFFPSCLFWTQQVIRQGFKKNLRQNDQSIRILDVLVLNAFGSKLYPRVGEIIGCLVLCLGGLSLFFTSTCFGLET